jgi:hypothetical protein
LGRKYNARCTFCEYVGTCHHYTPLIGQSHEVQLAQWYLCLRNRYTVDKRHPCAYAFANMIKSFNVNWPGYEMEGYLTQIEGVHTN